MEEKKDPVHPVPEDDESGQDDSVNPAAKKKNIHKKGHDKVHQQEEQIRALKKEIEEINDKYLRVLAETDNYRKRVAKEKEEFQKYALADFLFNLLQIYDNLERALSVQQTGNEKAVISGVEITVKQFLEILKSFQVQEIEALGKPFDPGLHEALTREERDDVAEPMVVEVYQKGFLYNNRLLRPALTKVAVPPMPPTIEPPADDGSAAPEPEGDAVKTEPPAG